MSGNEHFTEPDLSDYLDAADLGAEELARMMIQ